MARCDKRNKNFVHLFLLFRAAWKVVVLTLFLIASNSLYGVSQARCGVYCPMYPPDHREMNFSELPKFNLDHKHFSFEIGHLMHSLKRLSSRDLVWESCNLMESFIKPLQHFSLAKFTYVVIVGELTS